MAHRAGIQKRKKRLRYIPKTKEGIRTKTKTEFFFDYTLLFAIVFLLCFGLVMLYSVSYYDASLNKGSSTWYLRKQAFASVLGLVGMMVVANIDYHFWQKFAVPAYIVSVILILLVKTKLGITANGATRWISIFGLSLQPAEVAKLGMIVFFSSMICKMGGAIRTRKGIMVLLGSAVPIALLIYIVTKNLSSAIIICGIVILMLFVASPHYKYFILGGVGVLGIASAVVLVVSQGLLPEGTSFRLTRVQAWMNPEAYPTDQGFQTLQALYAIGSGGIWGKGLGESMQKLGFLPEAQNDMVFSIICEELGLFGAFSIIMLFLLIIWRFMVIANNAPDLYGALLVVGILGHIAIQVILNLAVVTNTIPNTGITLPFISYGGSSILFLLTEIGLALSVSRGIRLEK